MNSRKDKCLFCDLVHKLSVTDSIAMPVAATSVATILNRLSDASSVFWEIARQQFDGDRALRLRRGHSSSGDREPRAGVPTMLSHIKNADFVARLSAQEPGRTEQSRGSRSRPRQGRTARR